MKRYYCLSVHVLTAFNLLESFQHRFLLSFSKKLEGNVVAYRREAKEETKQKLKQKHPKHNRFYFFSMVIPALRKAFSSKVSTKFTTWKRISTLPTYGHHFPNVKTAKRGKIEIKHNGISFSRVLDV